MFTHGTKQGVAAAWLAAPRIRCPTAAARYRSASAILPHRAGFDVVKTSTSSGSASSIDRKGAVRPSVRRFASTASPALPDNLQSIVYDYERRRHHEDEGKFARILQGRYAGVLGMVIAGSLGYLMYAADDVSSEFQRAVCAILRLMGPDRAKTALLKAAAWNWLPKDFDKDDPYMIVEPHEGLRFVTPVGLAAGFDREAVGPNAFLDLGFGFVEVGPVRPDAIEGVVQRLATRDRTGQVTHLGIVGIALRGKCRQAILRSAEAVAPHVNYIALDLPRLPAEMRKEADLRTLVDSLVEISKSVPSGSPDIFVRIEASAAAGPIAAVALAAGASGLVISSGEEADRLDELVHALGDAHRSSEGRLVIIAHGGFTTGVEALELVEAGATVVQISDLLATEGPPACRRIKNEFAQAMINGSYVQLHDAIGAAHRKKKASRRKNPWKARQVTASA